MSEIVEIAQIKVGERRREEFGDLKGLAESIRRYGLIQPVVIDEDMNLVAGERRLRACRDILGHSHIEARTFGTLDAQERREIELEENLRRKDLTPYERAKEMVRRAKRTAEAVSSKLEETLPTGRPREYDAPKEDIAQAEGIGVGTLVRAEQHVETADQFPFMQKPDWKQSHVLEARDHLSAIPPEQAEVAAQMMSEPGIPADTGLKMLSNLRHMPDQKRKKVLQCYQSNDTRLQTFAKTEAVENPCAPDPRVLRLKIAIREHLRPCVLMFEDDPLNPRYASLCVEARELLEDTQRLHKERLDSIMEANGDGDCGTTA